MRHKSYNSNTSFLDLLFNALLGFVALFFIALILIKDETKKKKIDKKAEFIVTATWDSTLNHDVDMYMEDPEGNIIYFNARERGLMHLERDDLGFVNDTVKVKDGKVVYSENSEVITIRGVSSGEYVVNVHLYTKNADFEIATPVEVEIIKLNPYSRVLKKNILLPNTGSEATICRMVLDQDGEVKEIVEDLPKQLVPDSHLEGQRPYAETYDEEYYEEGEEE
jgi:hypothetical protein